MIDTEYLKSIEGQTLTDTIEATLEETHPNYRIKKPGYGYTQEVNPARLNLHVNENNIILGYSWG